MMERKWVDQWRNKGDRRESVSFSRWRESRVLGGAFDAI
jgi:hypothetical protein